MNQCLFNMFDLFSFNMPDLVCYIIDYIYQFGYLFSALVIGLITLRYMLKSLDYFLIKMNQEGTK